MKRCGPAPRISQRVFSVSVSNGSSVQRLRPETDHRPPSPPDVGGSDPTRGIQRARFAMLGLNGADSRNVLFVAARGRAIELEGSHFARDWDPSD